MAWPLASPAIDNQRAFYLGSTAANTTTGSKYFTMGSADCLSDMKGVQGVLESPFSIKKFIESD
jgi:hypothetical protein